MSWSVAYGLASFLLVVFITTYSHFTKVLRKLLQEELPAWSWWPLHFDFCVVTVLKLKEGKRDLNKQVQALHKEVVDAGGKTVYTGHAGLTMVQSGQFAQGKYDILLHSTWPEGPEGFKSRFLPKLSAIGSWDVVRSHGFHRNCWSNSIGVALLYSALKIRNACFPPKFSLAELATKDDNEVSGSHFTFGKMQAMADGMEKGNSKAMANPDDPIVIYNWIVNGNAEEKASKSKYGSAMMSMLAQCGGGPMHAGKAQAVQPLAEAGAFDTVLAVHYPSRCFVARLCRSAWMYKVAQENKDGDSMAVVTWPYRGPPKRAGAGAGAAADPKTKKRQ
jgi:hypothetical protein